VPILHPYLEGFPYPLPRRQMLCHPSANGARLHTVPPLTKNARTNIGPGPRLLGARSLGGALALTVGGHWWRVGDVSGGGTPTIARPLLLRLPV